MSKSEKVHISVTFLLITFFVCIFSKLFQRIRNQREILRFLMIPILNFWIKFFFCSFEHFLYTLIANAQETAKKTENLFLWMCLRIFIGNHQRVCITKLLKSLYPNVQHFSVYIVGIFAVELQSYMCLTPKDTKHCNIFFFY
jgi:hypothetical protein